MINQRLYACSVDFFVPIRLDWFKVWSRKRFKGVPPPYITSRKQITCVQNSTPLKMQFDSGCKYLFLNESQLIYLTLNMNISINLSTFHYQLMQFERIIFRISWSYDSITQIKEMFKIMINNFRVKFCFEPRNPAEKTFHWMMFHGYY